MSKTKKQLEVEVEQLRTALDAAVEEHKRLAEQLADTEQVTIILVEMLREVRRALRAGEPVGSFLDELDEALRQATGPRH